MKRLALFRYGSPEQIATELCEMISVNYDNCETCPVREDCRLAHTGFIDWVLDDVTSELDGFRELEQKIIQETMLLIDDRK